MRTLIEPTCVIRVYLSGPIEEAKRILRRECLSVGLCVTVEPTTFIFTGGEEQGYVVGFVSYPRFPAEEGQLMHLARTVAVKLLDETFQFSALIVGPTSSVWISIREDKP